MATEHQPRPRFWSGKGYSFGSPDVSNTAARYIAQAMTRVHPQQRAELLDAIIKHAEGARQIVGRAA